MSFFTSLGDFAWQGADGELWMENPESGEKKATGFFLQLLPRYPWPLSILNQSPTQFATPESARKAVELLRKTDVVRRLGLVLAVGEAPAVRVGPFTWGAAPTITVFDSDGAGVEYSVNAGLAIMSIARSGVELAAFIIATDYDRHVSSGGGAA